MTVKMNYTELFRFHDETSFWRFKLVLGIIVWC